MDTVSMLDKMRFYCQPILPLVYDESMSYYETLCKVVGQLNTTGETVNKLNEGLTGEIADRQAADSELDERLKLIESTNAKTHFLVFDGANPNGGFPTRHELYQWVEAGDAIFTLFRTYEEGRGQIDAVSCSYNAGNWGSEASNDFSIIVPIETSYDATRDYAVKQKVAKLTIPPIPQTNLNAPWGLQIIEVNTPYTSAEGVVNLVAVINDSDSVNCSITPSEFLGLYNTTRGGKNLCVAVNAKLSYDGLARSSSVATVDTTNRKIRIAFERDYGTFIENGVKQLNKTLDYIIGDASTNVWTHETIDSKTLDLSRYEGFQFTRGENNVITANDESTPNAVWAQYQSDHSGKIYQNLPVHLIDTVDNAEYWNGVFDIKDGNHMTFTFVTSNYATSSVKMLVRVIELSADVNTTVWKYAEKEFELPLNGSNGVVTYTASKVGEGEYKAAAHKTEYQVDFAEGVPAIIASIEAGNRVILRADLKESGSELGATPLYFASGYTRIDIFSNAISYVFSGSISNGHYTLELNSGLAHATLTSYGEVLPEPNPDGTDNGKVPTINGKKWELKTLPTAAPVDTAMSDTSTNAVQNKVIKKYVDNNASVAGAVRYDAKQALEGAQKLQARQNIGAVGYNSPQFQGFLTLAPANAPLGTGVGLSPTRDGNNFALDISDVNENTPTLLTGVKTPTDADTNAAATVEYVNAKLESGDVTGQNANLLDKNDTANQAPGKVFYVSSSNATLTNANGDTAIYFPVGKWGAGVYKFPIDYIQYGGSVAYKTALFNADKGYIKTKISTAVDTSDDTAYILSLDITQDEIDSGTYYIGLSIRTQQLGTSAMVVKDMDYPDSYIEYGTTTYKVQKLDNELAGKKASFCGDSICAGTSVGTASPIYGQGWAGIIGKKNGMTWQNLGVNGATVSETSASTGTLIIVNQLAKAYHDADYIILEGGCNDFDQMSGSTDENTMGKITAGWDDSYIKTTFAGALEHLFYEAVTKHPNAKIGYIIPPLMGRRNWEQYETISYRVYFNLAIDICKKWGIPYLDLWYNSPLNPNLTVYYDPELGVNGNIADASKCYVDGQHLTTTGYELIAPQIEAWMRTL